MSDEQKPGLLSRLKDGSAFARDLLLTAIVAICVLHPASIKSFLLDSGLSKLSFFGVSFELKEEKEKVLAAQEKVNAQVLADGAHAPGEPPPEASNAPVDPAFKEAILSAERVAPQILPSAGWVFLGRVDREKTAWADGGSSTVTAAWPVRENDVLTVKDDVYIRALSDSGYHSAAPVTTVAKVGDRLTVVELQYSAARVGGFFVWAKVAIRSS
jgi:hypothetical protein